MGLMDRDYTRRDDRQPPFRPPPERSGTSTLGMVLIFIAILLALYKIADWKLQQRAAQPAAQPAATKDQAERTAIKPAKPLTRSQPPQNADDAGAATQQVTKCVANGKTSYGDGPCTQGAIASQVRIHSDHNLMAAVRPESVSTAPTEVRQRSAVAQSNPAVDTAAAKKAECKSLDARVEQLDSMSRQPQSAQMQDWIRDERKKARDRQFRLSCA